MGVDCYGKAGNEFRNNWWWWRPLAEYCFEVAPSVCEGSHHYKQWTTNDGYMTHAEATELASALQAEIDAGRTKTYERARQARLEAMPDIVCEICHGTGKRRIGDGLPYFFASMRKAFEANFLDDDSKQLLRESFAREASDPRLGQPVECNGCQGYGTERPKETMYWFTVENIQEFADFCRKSGGFDVR